MAARCCAELWTGCNISSVSIERDSNQRSRLQGDGERRLHCGHSRYSNFSMASDGHCTERWRPAYESDRLAIGEAVAGAGYVLDQTWEGLLGLVERLEHRWRGLPCGNQYANLQILHRLRHEVWHPLHHSRRWLVQAGQSARGLTRIKHDRTSCICKAEECRP